MVGIIGLNIVLSILGTIGIYLFLKKMYILSGHKLYLTPLLICPLVIGVVLVAMNIPYNSYHEGSQFISWFLKPATVAFAIPLYKYRGIIREYAFQLVTVIGFACSIALFTSVGLATLAGLNKDLVMSVAPRSVTTPLAIAASDVLGGNPTITAVLVIATGILGMIMATVLIERQHIKNNFLKGLLLGITAHGTGTAKAYEYGPRTGVIASLAMIFMGIFTTLIAPVLAHYSSSF